VMFRNTGFVGLCFHSSELSFISRNELKTHAHGLRGLLHGSEGI
jgi:hypothetical protein